jgi:hypothetical protein
MSRKHNTTHEGRKRSNYPHRLQARGLHKAPLMADLESLRARQERRFKQDGSPWPDLWIPLSERHRADVEAAYGGGYRA